MAMAAPVLSALNSFLRSWQPEFPVFKGLSDCLELDLRISAACLASRADEVRLMVNPSGFNRDFVSKRHTHSIPSSTIPGIPLKLSISSFVHSFHHHWLLSYPHCNSTVARNKGSQVSVSGSSLSFLIYCLCDFCQLWILVTPNFLPAKAGVSIRQDLPPQCLALGHPSVLGYGDNSPSPLLSHRLRLVF